MTFLAQQKTHAVATMARYPMSMRLENTVVSYVRYLEKTFWPFSMATPYPHPGWWPAPTVVLSLLLLVLVTGAVIHFAKRFPFLAVGWLWFIGTLVPMVGLVQVGSAAMADRYSYLSGIGIFIMLAWGGAAIFEKANSFRLPMIILTVLVLAGLSLRTRDQLRLWQNDFVLFSHANAVTKNNYVALVQLGRWYSRHGQMSETLECYYGALWMDPDDPSVLYDIGNSFAKLGNWDEAIRDYRHALQFAPDSADILNNLGLALAQKNQMAEAQTNFEAALKIDPNLLGAHNNLATIFFRQGNYEEAARHFNLALEQTPDNPQLLAYLGETLLRQGKTDLAVRCYQRAAQLQPDNEKFRQRLQAIQQRSN
jgi:Flp pilus assembly protein TadD